MYQLILLHPCDYLRKISLKINMATEKAIAEMKSDTEQMMKLEQLYKGGSECELNSWL